MNGISRKVLQIFTLAIALMLCSCSDPGTSVHLVGKNDNSIVVGVQYGLGIHPNGAFVVRDNDLATLINDDFLSKEEYESLKDQIIELQKYADPEKEISISWIIPAAELRQSSNKLSLVVYRYNDVNHRWEILVHHEVDSSIETKDYQMSFY
ncbi:MAG: hypothetical protein H7A35_03030 [Planctomycetales bacterium]|nr:hypothetical protein [bacterium]UNM09031.1 MAG: hypothetical protein H7A35_03030 [Planctomycetales bacterium]